MRATPGLQILLAKIRANTIQRKRQSSVNLYAKRWILQVSNQKSLRRRRRSRNCQMTTSFSKRWGPSEVDGVICLSNRMVIKVWIASRPPFLLEPSTPNESTWDAGATYFSQSIHRYSRTGWYVQPHPKYSTESFSSY